MVSFQLYEYIHRDLLEKIIVPQLVKKFLGLVWHLRAHYSIYNSLATVQCLKANELISHPA
jgi:hypothetical protein